VTIFVRSADGRQLAVHVSGNPDGHPVVYLHGTPGSRVGPFPRGRVLYELGVRLISFDRPGYGGSDRQPGRRVANVARDVEAIADHLGLGPFAVVGRSGGGPHALACAALLPERVIAAVSVSAPAPFDADRLDWFAGWSPGIAAENRAAAAGRAALEAHWAGAGPEDMSAFFTDADIAALGGSWSWLAGVAGQAMQQGDEGFAEDTLAAVRSWGFGPDAIRVPVLIMHGTNDKMVPCAHGEWLAARCPAAELRTVPDAGHITVLDSAPEALAWLAARVRA
jgi:pimeloyl-ACP methyl ester carboxylesterase